MMADRQEKTLPNLNDDERRAALRKAIEVRKRNKELLDAVRSGSTSFADALNDPAYERIPAKRLLLAVPGVGNARCDLWFSEARIDEKRRVKGLGSRQRQYLLKAVEAIGAKRSAASSD